MNQHTSMRFARRMGESYPCPEYANAVERHEGPSPLVSPWFWIGALVSLGAWSLIWVFIAWLLDRLSA